MRAEVFLCFQVARPFRLSFQFLGPAAVLFRFGQHEHQRRYRVRPPRRLTMRIRAPDLLSALWDLKVWSPSIAIDPIAAADKGPIQGEEPAASATERVMESVVSDVRFSNRPVGLKHFQTIRHCSVERERALGMPCHRLCRRRWGIGADFGNGMAVAQSRLGRSGPHQTETINEAHIPFWNVDFRAHR
jgi:hypothetical protein